MGQGCASRPPLASPAPISHPSPSPPALATERGGPFSWVTTLRGKLPSPTPRVHQPLSANPFPSPPLPQAVRLPTP